VVIDLRYQLPAEADPGLGARSPWREVQAPRPTGPVFLGPVYWQVGLPGGWEPFCLSGTAAFDTRWGLRRGFLLTPHAGRSAADLAAWLRGGPDAGDGPSGEDVFVARQASLAPLRLVVVPWEMWLLACSGAAVFLGLLLAMVRPVRWLFWSIVAAAGAAAAVAAFAWPQPAGEFFAGAQPGLLGLGLLFGAQWWLHRRYRRRLEYMPAFTRVPAQSSLLRAAPAPRSSHPGSGRTQVRPAADHGEPSTVDQPTPADGWAAPSDQLRTPG
jgi:hypothetical protein